MRTGGTDGVLRANVAEMTIFFHDVSVCKSNAGAQN